MRNLVVLLVLLCATLTVNAQTFREVTKKASTSMAKTSSIVIEGKTFTGGISKNGITYIIRTSKEGKEYKQYLGVDTKKLYNSHKVYLKTSREGVKTYYYYIVNKNGNLSAKQLIAD